jgi:hypothetical protein
VFAACRRRLPALAALAAVLAVPGVASAQQSQCPETNPSYTDACGPTFVLPGWGDAGGWTDPSQYSTIQLADLNGDGSDELLGRNDQGLEIWRFDTSVGQWRPQVNANGTPIALSAFASPPPGDKPATDWTKPQYYSTIQAADIDGRPGEEILARFADGMHAWSYTPPAGSNSIDGGTWRQIATGGPFGDAAGGADPSIYSTIQAAQFQTGAPGLLFARVSVDDDDDPVPTVLSYGWDAGGGTFTPALTSTDWEINGFGNAECSLPSATSISGPPTSSAEDRI